MKYKKIIVLMLIISLMITSYGCIGKKETLDTSGSNLSYKEIILSDTLEEEYISAIDINSDNELVLCSEGDTSKYLILDKKGEVKKEISIDINVRGDVFTINDNKMYILSEKSKKNADKEIIGLDKKLLLYNGDADSINEDNVIGEDSDNTVRSVEDMAIKAEVDSKGNIYALKLKGSIEVYDNNLKLARTIDSAEYKDIAIYEEDNLLALQGDTQRIVLEKIDTKDYKRIWSQEYDSTNAPQSIYYNKNTKSLYGINGRWIVKYDGKGKMISRLLNTAELSTIDSIIDFAVDNDEEIYLIAQVGDKYKLIKYANADEEETNKADEIEKTEITIELWQDWGNFLTKAAKKFEKEHLDIKVTVKTNLDLEESRYREKLNTELMAGKGPDVIFLDYYDYKRIYAEKGILANLDETIEKDKDFNINDYNKRIIDISRYKDNIYIMPIHYAYFYTFVLNERLLNEKGISSDNNMTWRDVYNLSKRLNENSDEKIYVLPKLDDKELFDQIILQDIDYYMDWDKKKAKFDSTEFINSLQLLKDIKEDDIMHPELDWFYILKKYDRIDMDLSNIAIYPGQIAGYYYIRSFGSFFDNNFNVVSGAKGEYTGNRQFLSRSLSINTNSLHKEEAWEFIKFILSEEMQMKNEEYLHINNKANEKEIAKVFEFQEKYKKDMEKKKLYYVQKEDIEKLNRIIGNLNKLRTGDPFYDVIYEEIQPFLKGEKTAEETAKMTQNKAEIYLLE